MIRMLFSSSFNKSNQERFFISLLNVKLRKHACFYKFQVFLSDDKNILIIKLFLNDKESLLEKILIDFLNWDENKEFLENIFENKIKLPFDDEYMDLNHSKYD